MKPPPVPFNSVAFKAVCNAIPARDDPRLLAKLAFGISTPKISELKLYKDPLFGCMDDHTFPGLLKSFQMVCSKG